MRNRSRILTQRHQPTMLRTRRHLIPALVCVALVAALVASACGGDGGADGSTPVPQPTAAQLKAAGLEKLPLAPESKRLDLTMPALSNPTEVTNPLFPISDLHSAILSGRVDGNPFHTETTLLPQTRVIEWTEGRQVEALVSQYMAFIDGRLQEAALDYYAQADDGSVWYLGEDVFDYRDGEVFTTEGTWLAGKEGPPEMIMPAAPRVGDVHRAENIPAVAFEEVEVKTTGKTVNGPTGPVDGAIVGHELHDDGTYSDKVFAPGYGEFLSRHQGDVEAMALAVPTDALGGPVPPALKAISGAADESFDALQSNDWSAAAAGAEDARAAWRSYRSGDVPPRLATEMTRAIDELSRAIDTRDRAQAGTAAIDVAQSALDLELRYLPPAEIDVARFELWARQIQVDASAGDLGGITGDVATMEWIRDRFTHTLDPADVTRINTHLLDLQGAVADKDPAAAREAAAGLRDTLAGLTPTSGGVAS
jgi:hypothetical protein